MKKTLCTKVSYFPFSSSHVNIKLLRHIPGPKRMHNMRARGNYFALCTRSTASLEPGSPRPFTVYLVKGQGEPGSRLGL